MRAHDVSLSSIVNQFFVNDMVGVAKFMFVLACRESIKVKQCEQFLLKKKFKRNVLRHS